MRNIDDLRMVKAGEGPDIVLWGSSTHYPQLFEGNLIDRFLLLTCPIVLGKGKKLFGSTSHPVNMKLRWNSHSGINAHVRLGGRATGFRSSKDGEHQHGLKFGQVATFPPPEN